MSTVFRPTFGRVLSVAVWLICLVTVVLTAPNGVGQVLAELPWLLLASGAVWALFWNPRVVVDDGGVHVVNVLRTFDIPWPAIQQVDTKWALTLVTAYGRITAWAAPAPGGLAGSRRMIRSRREDIPQSARGPGNTVRPADLPGTASGSAATAVRHRWEELRAAGWLDDPRLEGITVPMRRHWLSMTIGAALALGCLVTALL